MRLFTAAIPPPDVLDKLAVALDGTDHTDWVPRDSWHITLGYYGEDDPATRVPWVRERMQGLVAPKVSLTDAGNFGNTLWIGVSRVDPAFNALGAALRFNDRHDWHPHLTIGHGDPLDLPYSSPEWTIGEVVLLGADRRYEYTVVDRFGFAV
nr:2'-5' RNA ligase family protein [Kibdelosporangium sp. MJ126-NF4]CEL16790.1 2'-5' RNA ligase [Kibdelosporangium sp. MJ126-NF4]CTQ91981.1 2'-5' RNA ligase [Kibdelosporangium sp. MJ126-NF4]